MAASPQKKQRKVLYINKKKSVPHFQNKIAPMKDIKLCLVAGVQEGK